MTLWSIGINIYAVQRCLSLIRRALYIARDLYQFSLRIAPKQTSHPKGLTRCTCTIFPTAVVKVSRRVTTCIHLSGTPDDVLTVATPLLRNSGVNIYSSSGAAGGLENVYDLAFNIVAFSKMMATDLSEGELG